MVNIPSPAVSGAPAQPVTRDWRVVVIAITLGLSVFGFMFWAEIRAAVAVWINSDAYNHCFLVLPVAVYLLWERRSAATATQPRPSILLAFLALPIAAGWFAAERLGIMEGRQLMAMGLAQIMFLSLLGWRTWYTLAAPFLYLFFLVPFGDSVVPSLQSLVVRFSTLGLDMFGIPNVSNGVVIEIPEGIFVVHQACSGLRFLIATLAFGTLYACIMYTSLIRRASFIGFSLAAAILGNCVRVLGTIVIAHFIGNAQAVEADHILWGWLFYVIIGTVLVAVGWVFRQEQAQPTINDDRAWSDQGSKSRRIAAVAVVLLAFAMIPRAGAAYLEDLGKYNSPTLATELPQIPGCAQSPIDTQSTAEMGRSTSHSYICEGNRVIVTVRRYPPRIDVRALFSSIRSATTPPDWDIIFQSGDFEVASGATSSVWRLTDGSTERGYLAQATSLWLDGRPTGLGLPARLHQAINTVKGASAPPALIVVTSYEAREPNEAAGAVKGFLSRTEPVLKMISHPPVPADQTPGARP